jgi:hypothetical protein
MHVRKPTRVLYCGGFENEKMYCGHIRSVGAIITLHDSAAVKRVALMTKPERHTRCCFNCNSKTALFMAEVSISVEETL